MNQHSTYYAEIQQLRMRSLTRAAETVAVVLFSLAVPGFLTDVILQRNPEIRMGAEPPVIFTYLPYISLVLSAGYFLFMMVGNLMRERKATRLEREALNLLSADTSLVTEDLDKLDAMVDAALAKMEEEETNEAPHTEETTVKKAKKKGTRGRRKKTA